MYEVNSDEFWMSKAIEQALKAESIGEVPVGAVIVKNNELIATGYNQVITLNDSSAHAEVMALRNAGSNIGNYRVVDTTM
ncbi:MAG TPA: deaminase, partial [Gammaproteobacteria bacterium]|nr:deaminase [Gammaproteobacteria bacterium]